ncbi:MAG: MmgE/PrpD family protein [Dehalococcoidia bacterium]
MGATQLLARHVLEHSAYDLLPPQVVATAKEMMLNAAAVALAAAAQPDGQRITQFVQEMGGNGKCTIIGRGLRSSPVYAALANGLMVHLLDFDDVIISSGIHPSCTVFPVVMALGEMNGSTGREVLAAFVQGCEVTSKLAGLLSTGLVSHDNPPRTTSPTGGWQFDAIAGTIGATVAAGLLLGLSQKQLEQALGTAAGQASGIQANRFTAARALQCGTAAMNGVMAARLSQQGLSGARDALESAGGWAALFSARNQKFGQEIGEELVRLLSRSWDILDPGVTLKLYPCHIASHTAIDAALQLAQLHRMEPSQMVKVQVSITPAAMAELPFATPQNGWEARFCPSYIVAVALLHGHPLIDFFSDSALEDREVRAFMDRISVEATQPTSGLAPYPTTVSIQLENGQLIQQTSDFARGQPQLPLEQQELDAKFLYCSRYILPPDHIEEAIDSFRGLENIENITGMASVLGG